MEQKTIRLNFDLSFVYGPRTLRVPLAAVMMLAAAGELNSESVTLSTYYPAPSGVYTNMITTDNTYLARDAGRIGVGTTTPGSKLSVSGSVSMGTYAGNAAPANALIVGGSVGVGLTNPGSAIDVYGNINVAGSAVVGEPKGYIKINARGCGAPMTKPALSINLCAANEYATFTPGVYIEGLSYQNVAGPFVIAPNTTTRLYKVLGQWGGVQSEMEMGISDAVRYVCCLK